LSEILAARVSAILRIRMARRVVVFMIVPFVSVQRDRKRLDDREESVFMESVLAVQLQVWCENRATAIYHDGFLVNLSLLTGVLQRKAPAIDVVTPLGV